MAYTSVIPRPQLLLTLLILLLPPILEAQRYEITPFYGYRYPGRMDATTLMTTGDPADPFDFDNPLGVSRLKFNERPNYGVGFLVNLHDIVGLEFNWSHQDTELEGKLYLDPATRDPLVWDANIDQFHGIVQVHSAGVESATRPYALVGIGMTRWEGSGHVSTHISYSLGAGLKQSIASWVGIRVQGRWTPTYLGSTPEGLFCDLSSDATCWVFSEEQVMSQGDYTAGIFFKF